MNEKDKLPTYRSREFYAAIGKRGGKRRVEKHGIEQMKLIGARGGQRTKELSTKGKLYEQQIIEGGGSLPPVDGGGAE